MNSKEFKESAEYKTWKKNIVRRRLEKLDQLLSTGEWVSNTQMMEAVNELYIEAPDECYHSIEPPHKVIEEKEGSRKKYLSILYLMHSGTIRQDRKTIHDILRMVGKDHIWEAKDMPKGAEGYYRYSTTYSIFEKHSINDIPFDDYELYKSVPVVLDTIQSELKTDKDKYLTELTKHIGDIDLATDKSLTLLSTLSQALKRAQALNKNHVSILLNKVYDIYDNKNEGWEQGILKNILNAYYSAAHPDADFDITLLFYLRLMLIMTKIINGDEDAMLELLNKELVDLNLSELDSVNPDVREFILAAIKYYVFQSADYEGMGKELEKHYKCCISANNIQEDYALMIAIHSHFFPNEWQYDETLVEFLDNLITLYDKERNKTDYIRWMLLLFTCIRQYTITSRNETPASCFTELSKYKFSLLTAIKPDSIMEMIMNKSPEDDFHCMLNLVELCDQARFVEYMITSDLRFDMSDILRSLINQDNQYLNYLTAKEAQAIYEDLMIRFEKLDNVFSVVEHTGLLACKLSLALLHDSLSQSKEALQYYTAVMEMSDNNEVKLSAKLLKLILERIDALLEK